MIFFTSTQTRLFKRFSLLLFIYTLLRIGFYFYHLSVYRHFTQDEIFESFILGIRFDIAAILLVNSPIILLSLFLTRNSFVLFFERLLFVILNSTAILIAIDDFELFHFMGKRLSYDLFVITDDILDQLPQLVKNFWYLPLFVFSFGVASYYFDRKYFSLIELKSSWRSHLFSLFIIGVSFIGIRGGLQHKSINVQSAFIQGKNELGHLVLNSPYHFLRTLKNEPKKKLNYFKSDDDAKNIILNRREFREVFKGQSKANVVLIILESFSSEYVEKGYAPFLSELKNKGAYFDRHLANGRRSIESLPSLLCGQPSLLNEPISKSIYAGNKFNCFPKNLKEAGYTNFFFHAGAKGTMGFEAYTLANGFDKYFSKEDYGDKDFDGTWGIFDLPFLQFTAKQISQLKEPFLVGVFTLSSHQPYKIPDEFKGKFSKGTLEIHESIGYTDLSLRKFFESIQNESWFKNTYFIITADHSQKVETKKYSNIIGRYRVPLLVLGPGIKPETKQKVTQHSDIPKTVLDLVEVKGEMPATSVSAFNDDVGLALNYADGTTYFMVAENFLFTLDSRQEYDWDSGRLSPHRSDSGELLKAYLQYFINGLITNNLSI
jgi:phosphoglycerol transferase MdoB-like AlkP superfamily enzyme